MNLSEKKYHKWKRKRKRGVSSLGDLIAADSWEGLRRKGEEGKWNVP